jgi:hypothetical protein
LLVSILAVVSAAFMPLAATSQIAPDRPPRAPKAEATQKYEVFAGYGYTSINQINQSRYGLQGVDISVTRDWGRYFGIIADGSFYKYSIKSGSIPNPGTPSVDSVLVGPVLHANLFRNYDGFFRVLLGGAHTGGENAYPNISFAGGVGVGVDYKLSSHFSLRISGDDIASSFVAPVYPAGSGNVCTTTSDCSPHRRRNSRAAFGVVYKF